MARPRTPDPDEPQVPKNAVPKKVAAKPKKAPPKPKKLTGVPFQPTSLMPVTETALLNNMMADYIKKGGKPTPPSRSIRTLRNVVSGIEGTTDIKTVQEEVTQATANQPEKAVLVDSMFRQLAYERMVRFAEMRDASERTLHAASLSGDMDTSTALAVFTISNAAINEERKFLQNVKPVDSVTVINKVDIHQQRQEAHVAERWQNTTPQGREIIRKKLYELEKKVKSAKASEPPAS